MKKRLFSLLAFLSLLTWVYGQVSINNSTIAGHGEKVYTASASSTIPPAVVAGSPGPNQTWNFSDLVAENNDSILFFHADSTAYSSFFPSANLAIEGPNYFTYFRNDTTGLYQLGDAGDFYSTAQACASTATPPYRMMVWPATYGQNFSDTLDLILPPCPTSDSDSVARHTYYTIETTVDAWGTMLLPGGSFNCLRLKRTFNYTDTLWSYYNGNPWSILYIANGASEQYEWWSDDPAVRYQLASLGIDTVSNTAAWVTWLEVGGTTTGLSGDPENNFVGIFPNPAADEFTLSFSNKGPARLIIFNQYGQPVRTYENVHNGQTIRPDLENGLYYCRLQSNGELTRAEKLILSK